MNSKAQKRDLVITRRFNAPVALVWKAWTDPEWITRWWGPNGFSCALAEIDFREGGTALVCMRAPKEFGGQDLYSTWEYLRIAPMERIEFIHNLADHEGNKIDPASIGMPADFPQDMRHLVAFKEVDGATELTVTEYDWPAGQMMEMSKIGMEQCLDKMSAIFAGG